MLDLYQQQQGKMMADTVAVDRDALQAFTTKVSREVLGGLNCALTFVGDQLGLFKAMAELGPTNSEALSEHLGLSERWVREWLYQQACTHHIEYDESTSTFSLSPEASIVLATPEHPAYLGGMLHSVTAMYETLGDLPESFRTGLGQSYDDKGESCACGIERMSKKFQSDHLVPDLLPRLDGIVGKLEAGAQVADVGCGAATSTVAMGRAFPDSAFSAYDISVNALARAKGNIDASGLSNIRLCNSDHDPLPEDGSLDLVTTFDVIHDSTHPRELIRAIRRSLRDDGTWLCADIRGGSSFEENLRENPFAGMAYSFSVLVCMSSGLSVPDGAGLGTLGFHEQKAREMSEAEGFSRFRLVEYEGDQFNAFYEIRP